MSSAGFLKEQRGSTSVLFVTVLLSMFVLCTAITFDVAVTYSRVRSMQRVMDDAALYAQRFMPNRIKAKEQAHEFLKRTSILSDKVEISTSTEGLQLVYTEAIELFFAKYFGIDQKFTVSTASKALSIPYDVFIYFDVLSETVPKEGEYFGSITEYGPAQYFTIYNSILSDTEQRYGTELCFNPIFVPIKKLTTEIFDYYRASDANYVEVKTTALTPQLRPKTIYEKGGAEYSSVFIDGAHTPEQKSPFSKDLCLLLADTELMNDRYTFSSNRSILSYYGSDTSYPAYTETDGTVKTDIAINPRDLIWSQKGSSEALKNTESLLRDISFEFTRSTSTAVQRAPGIANKAIKKAVIVTPTLPRASSLEFPDSRVRSVMEAQFELIDRQLAALDKSAKIYFVITGDIDSTKREQFKSYIESLNAQTTSLKVVALFSNDETILLRDVYTLIVRDGENALLAK